MCGASVKKINDDIYLLKYDCCEKCVTILIFQTGKVIITGAKKIKHLKKTYKFINDIFKEKYLEIKK